MPTTRILLVCALIAAADTGDAGAQTDSAARAAAAAPVPAAPVPAIGPPIRRISTASAVSKERITSINSVRELPDGRVLVNDGGSRRLLLMDTMLVTERVVLDSVSDTENTYGTRQGALLAHRGDSTIFIDPTSLALLVIDQAGNVARVRSVPRTQDTYSYGSSSGSYGQPATDAKGRLVYRKYAEAARPVRPPPRGVPFIPQEPDSAFIVALDMDARRLDTVGVIRIPKSEYSVRVSPNGGWRWNESINPLPSTDEWAVLPDGAIAFVRGIDYRVDYLNADGTWTSSPKIQYDWQPLPDSVKQQIVDSVKETRTRSLRTSFTTSVIRWVNTYGKKYPAGFTAPDGYRPPNGFAKSWKFPPGVEFPARYIYACAQGEEPTMIEAPGDSASPTPPAGPPIAVAPGIVVSPMGGMPGGQRGTPSCIPQPIPNLARVPDPPTMRDVSVMSPRELPDFRPPFAANAVRADLDGNLWIRTIQPKAVPGGPVYDVVSREGKLVDRLQLPPGYNLVGFGRGKVVFLSMRDASGMHLARVRLK